MENDVRYFTREGYFFAGIRKPIKSRDELFPRIELLKKECKDEIDGPLIHIFRYDTPVDGFDSEIGFPVKNEINSDEIKTKKLRKMHFYSMIHKGEISKIRETTIKIYQELHKSGLASELELMEIYHNLDLDNPENNEIEICASFLPWPELYKDQLIRVLGNELATIIWEGGEEITPLTQANERAKWVGESIEVLKKHSNLEQQFDILSRVALKRPEEDVSKFQKIYEETGSVDKIIETQNENLSNGPTGGFLDMPYFDGKILHLSKVPYNRAAYDKAITPLEKRKAFCFCTVVRESDNPEIDPIFCYRAAGWSRQFWEPILGVKFKKCIITKSILKGDDYCAWDYYMHED